MMPSFLRSAGRAAAGLLLLAVFACLPAREASAVATTPRYAHAAAVMVDGRTIVAGGVSGVTGLPTNTVEILDTLHGSVFVTPTQNSFTTFPMNVARASATITVLPNGSILIAGGWDGAIARSDAEVYDPAAAGAPALVAGMQIGRVDHTATLLNNGRVLICGGESAPGTITALCDLFTPNGSVRPGGATCVAAGGCFDATSSLLLGRARHTSSLLSDGTVWIAGGWNQTVPNGGWVVTTERYNPGTGNWQQAQPLNVARAYHTATVMGDGRVLVVGGFNGRSLKDQNGFLTSLGILQTSEIFDPTGGAIVPGPPMQTRIHKHAAVLQADGEVAIYGGFGNIPSTRLTATIDPVTLSAGAYVSGSASTSTANNFIHVPSTSGAATINLNFFMDTPATGWIADGEIDFTSASVVMSDGYADFVTADENNPAIGLRASLKGVYLGCDPASGKCGQVKTTLPLPLVNMNQGGYHLASPKDAQNLQTAPSVSGTLNFTCGGQSTISFTCANGSVTSGTAVVNTRLGLSALVAGWNITSVNCSFNANDTLQWAQQSTYTATINGGSSSMPGPYTAQTSGSLVYIDVPGMTFNGLTGTIVYTGASGNANVAGPNYAFGPSPVNVMACSLSYTSTGMNLGGGVLKFDSYYAIVRNLLSSDFEFYAPSRNVWGFAPVNGSLTRPSKPAEGAAALHLTNDDILTVGGRTCSANCASFVAATAPVGRQDWGLLNDGNNFASGPISDNTHAYHSANLLNDGTILIAGGTDGSYVQPYGEIFDPVAQTFVSTGILMHTARQQHSAHLLPNGRVLLAGGFATTAASTGPTNSAELYFPDTKLFLNTGVMISSHSQHAAVSLPNGNVFVAGGYDNGTNVTNVAEVYFATAGAWGALATMPTRRAIAPAVQLPDGRILTCGGTNSSGILGSCDAYDPSTNLWNIPVAPAPMPTGLQGHTMTLLPDGTVLVAGGNDGFGETNSSFLYYPGANTWNTVNPLVSARFGHSATALPNGTVMVTGGVQQVAPVPGSAANALRSVEFYHPFVASWSDSSGTLKLKLGPRSFHTATLAPDGNVYLFGGANGSIGAGQGAAFYTKYESGYFTSVPDGNGRIQPSIRQSTITSTTASPFLPNTAFTAAGLRFRGSTEGSGGGSASANSSFNYPRLLLQKIDGGGGSAAESSPGFVVDLSTQIPLVATNLATLDTQLKVQLPATNAGLPYGWYMTWVANNDVFSLRAPLVQVGPPKPSVGVTALTGTTLGVSSITYSWTGIGGVDGYAIYSATNGYFLGIQPSTVTTFTQSNLLPNTTAGIAVAGYTVSGDGPLVQSATMYTLPSPPANLTISSVTFNTLALQWGANGNLPGTIYEVGQSSDNFVTSFSTPVPSILGLTATAVTITQLQPNTTYYFRARAYNSAGLPSPWTASVSTLTRTSVSGVVGTAVSPNSIQWNWIPAGSVLNYKVYNSTSGQLLATTVSNSYLDTGLGIDTLRAISVTAITPAGEGPLSPPATAYTMAAAPGFVAPLSGLTTGSFTLQWAPNGNPNGINYQVLLVDYSSPTAAQISTANTTAFTYSFGGLFSATQYATFIYGVNGDGVLSAPLIVGSTWTLSRTPSALAVTGTNPISLSAQWSTNQVSTNAYYQVNYSTDNFVSNVSTAILLSSRYNGSTVTITGLLTSTTYWLRVMAVNANGQPTPFSNVVATVTFNGGAPLGSVAGVVSALNPSLFSGNLGNGRVVQIRSPGGSFPTNTMVIISSYDATVPLCPGGLNVAFSIYDNPALQPTSPIFFTASYLPAELGTVPTSRISLQRYDPADTACVPLKTTFDTASNLFTAQLNHFSLYQLVAVPLATDTGSLRVFPNPYRAATDSYITFDNIPPAARVRVTTLRGETVLDAVADGTGLLTWNASNGAGRSVASGLYLVIVESGGSKKISKLAVIR